MQDDRNIILYATKDEQAEKELREKFKPQDTNVKLVAMDSKAVDDYLKQVEKQERKDVSAKLTQARWRQTAFNEAMRLWRILTNGAVPDSRHTLTKKLIVQKTNLKLNEAGDLLDFLAKYGFVEYTQGRYAFHMHFDKEVRREALRSDIENKLQDVRDDLVEYKRLLGKDETEDYSTQEQELTKQTAELVKTT